MNVKVMWTVGLVLCVLLAACADRQKDADQLWNRSMSLLNRGEYGMAMHSATELERADPTLGTYMQSQVLVYVTMLHGRYFAPLRKNFSELADLDGFSDGMYEDDFIFAKGFALLNLHGASKARPYLARDCMRKLHEQARACAEKTLKKYRMGYLSVQRKYDAVMLYETAYVAGVTGLVDKSEATFSKAIAVRSMDIRYSDYLIKGLLAKGEFAPEYRELFCEYVDVLKDPSNVVSCASYMTI